MKNSSDPAEQIGKLFDEIDDIYFMHGPVAAYPDSLLKARLDCDGNIDVHEE